MGVKLLLIVGLCLAFINGGYSEPVGTCPAVNGAHVTFLTDSNDCSIFYKCETGKPHLYQCPSDLYFNHVINVCDWPEQVDCTRGTVDNGGPNGTVVDECPAENGQYVAFIPHETDCTLFYKCDWGVPILYTCPDDLHFNPILAVCDFPEDAGCGSGNGGDNNGNGNNGNGGDGGDGDNNGGGDEGGIVVDECPAENGEYVAFVPHETDCTLFYKCDWGVPILFTCPDGLHFNPTLAVCDVPEDAGCEGGNGGGGGSDEDDNGGGDEGGIVVDECPAENGQYVAFIPHATDCTLFYKCDWGVPILYTCPDDLHFNPILAVCDFPEDAGCEGGNVSVKPEPEPPVSGYCESLSCPSENEEYVTFIPFENDCTRFCKCDWGEAHEFVCPDGLFFNPVLNVCDWPEDSGCVM